MNDIEKRARELLAAEYVKEGRVVSAQETMQGHDLTAHAEYIALRAIIAALTPPEGCELAAAARAALPFIAYAFDQGMDGAEQAGRAIEAALQANQPVGHVLVPVEPTPGLLMSMAMRSDHALGCPGYYDQLMFKVPGHVDHQRMLDAAIADARKQHQEVVGTGFYAPEREGHYAALLSARSEVSP